jgi:hypothetical protein
MTSEWSVSIRRACRLLHLDPKTYRYRSRRPGQAVLEAKIKEICATRVRYGYRRVHVLLLGAQSQEGSPHLRGVPPSAAFKDAAASREGEAA